MKKHGFTLTELLVTLGIIGVVAAILAPTLGNLMPDKNKAMVLKIYKNISEITDDLLKDSTVYYRVQDCTGLQCTGMPRASEYQNAKYEGANKYVNLLAANLQLSEENPTFSGNTAKFTTMDGVEWSFKLPQGGSYNQTLTVDLNGSDKGKNCHYGEDCKKPDQFIFTILESGKIIGADPLTIAYLNNPLKLNDKKADLQMAEETSSLLNNVIDTDTGESMVGKEDLAGIKDKLENFEKEGNFTKIDTDQPDYWYGSVKPVEEINYDNNGFKKRVDSFEEVTGDGT